MARLSSHEKAAPSSELGDGDFAVTYNRRTGRPIRRSLAAIKAASPFVDSAVAISDEEGSDDEGELTTVSRKRKRSPSPPLSVANEPDPLDSACESLDESDDDEAIRLGSAKPPSQSSPAPSGTMQITLKDITINVPAGHQGPIVLHLEPSTATAAVPAASASRTPKKSRKKVKTAARGRRKGNSQGASKGRAGFLDLPAELRNEIYRLVFVSEEHFNFGGPTNFSRGAAFLRTCSQIHAEARSILYGENEFYFNRRTSRYGSFWENDWRELGYRSLRHFLKQIGPSNTSLIRHVVFQFEDATPCLNPITMSHEDRRFVHDDALMSILRHLSDYSQLQTLKINFHGRRRVENTDQRLLQYLRRIKADTVEFCRFPIGRGQESYWTSESKQEDSVRKMLLKSMVRKHKMFE
ncbi:hypothetical protein Tdes44962_MAKER06376 [Teratosphaeria destructans]|uniref:Uncharacterized protein n=1 Tax=Teratosphaeria destructans TaxID=418781 RepID=A0A9W7SH36_9PEZI|nr:hypothetical protein Tdes44962_MAKER06376 [Teratosphaeria destructans]